MDTIHLLAGTPPGNTTTTETPDRATELAALRTEIAALTERADALQASGKPRKPSLRSIRARSRQGGSMKIEFKPATIAALEPPAKGDAFAWNQSVPGFGIRIGRTGHRSYIVQYRNPEGRSIRHTIGDVRVKPLKDAEKRAKQILDAASDGRDLLIEEAAAAEREKIKVEQHSIRSVGAIVEGYLAHRDIRELRSFDQTARYLRLHWKPIHQLSGETISRHDLAGVLAAIDRDRGPVAANRAQSAIAGMFVYCMTSGVTVTRDDGSTEFVLLRREVSPAALLKKRPEKSRERVLKVDELGALWRGVEAADPNLRAVVRLLILSGCRLREVADLRWSEIALEEAEIRLPGARTKNQRPHVIPLPPIAVEILRDVPRLSERLVFGSRSWTWAKKTIEKAVVLSEPWTFHDLRRSLATSLREHGIADTHLVELIINHAGGSRGGVAGVYDRSERMADRRKALTIWADLVLHAAGELDEAVEIRRAKDRVVEPV